MAGGSLLARTRSRPVLSASSGAGALLWPAGRGAAHAQARSAPPGGPGRRSRPAPSAWPATTASPRQAGEDVSIGVSWRASMMAHSSRDPVLAGRRPARSDRPSGARRGDRGRVLHLPHADDDLSGPRRRRTRQGVRTPSHRRPRRRDPLAADGVSCTVCHQITDERLGIARELHRRLRPQRRQPRRPAADVRAVRRSMRAGRT